MVYSFADFKFEYKGIYGEIERISADYETNEKPEFSIEVTKEDIELEREIAEQKFPEKILETTAFYRKLANLLPEREAFVMHSALFDVEGEGVAFGALSGTGKTTHMLLWKSLLGDKMTIVNGDKPIIRFKDGVPLGFGTPFCGKERLGCNMKTELKHICFIERAKENSCKPLSKEEALNRILTQVYMPSEPQKIMLTMELIDRILSSCKLWLIKCNMDISAAKTAYNTIFGGNKNEA